MANDVGVPLSPRQRQLLRRARKELALTQVALAAQLGTKQGHLAQYELGTKKPPLEVLERWTALVGYTVKRSRVRLKRMVASES